MVLTWDQDIIRDDYEILGSIEFGEVLDLWCKSKIGVLDE